MDFGDLFKLIADWWIYDFLTIEFYFFGVRLTVGAVTVWCVIAGILIYVWWRLQ